MGILEDCSKEVDTERGRKQFVLVHESFGLLLLSTSPYVQTSNLLLMLLEQLWLKVIC